MQDIAEQEENKRYSHSSRGSKPQQSRDFTAPFAVRDAPWHQSVSRFDHLLKFCEKTTM